MHSTASDVVPRHPRLCLPLTCFEPYALLIPRGRDGLTGENGRSRMPFELLRTRLGGRRLRVTLAATAGLSLVALLFWLRGGRESPQVSVLTQSEAHRARAEAAWADARQALAKPEASIEQCLQKLGEVTAHYDRAIASYPGNGWAFVSRAYVRLECADLAAAEKDFATGLVLLDAHQGKAAQRGLAQANLERAFTQGYVLTDAGIGWRSTESARAAAGALYHFTASAGDVPWQGEADKDRSLRRLAEAYLSALRGNLATARKALQEALDTQDDPECGLALALLSEGAARERALEAVLRKRPRHLRALLLRAQGLCAANRFDEALADYALVLRLQPRCPQAFVSRGATRFAQGNVDQAAADYEEALKLSPAFAAGYTHRGFAKYAQGDTPGATADWTKAIELDRDNFEAYTSRAHVRRTAGELAGALADYTEALRVRAGDLDARLNRGYARYAAGDLDGSIADFTDVLRVDPRRGAALTSRGYALWARSDAATAESDWSQALAVDPADVQALAGRGAARRLRKDFAGALADYTEALRVDPRAAQAFAGRGAVRQETGDTEGAIADFTEALRLFPRYPAAFAGRAAAFRARGKFAPAVLDYTELLRVQPRDAATLLARGTARLALRDREGALADLTEALRLDGRNAETYVALARLYAQDEPAPAPGADAAAGASPSAETRARRTRQAFEYLETALALGWADLAQLTREPDLASLRSAARWKELVSRLPAPAPTAHGGGDGDGR